MSLWDDYEADAIFARDFPFGVPCSIWKSKSGNIPVKDMSVSHITNCMKIVGEDDPWFSYFQEELKSRCEK